MVTMTGDIHATNVTACTLTPSTFTEVANRSIQLYINEYVLGCAINAFQSSGALDQLLNQQLHSKLSFDDHIFTFD